jgi:adenosylhomocysteine nucleosidase
VSSRLGVTRRVVVVTGLAAEARIAAGPGVCAIAGGGSASALSAALERELERGASAILSFGIAGGLAEDLVCGAWIVASAIVTPTQRWPCDRAWAAALAERLTGARTADLAGVDAPVIAAAAKRALQRTTGAAAVDTESHLAAAIAAARGVPFAAFRVIADCVGVGLPPAASVALSPGGGIRGGAVLGSLARSPRQLPSLLRTAIDARTALRALSRGRRLLGPGLGCPDFDELLLDVS